MAEQGDEDAIQSRLFQSPMNLRAMATYSGVVQNIASNDAPQALAASWSPALVGGSAAW